MILIITEARGISIGSCLAKLYSTVLYLRILEVNENFQQINNKQIGFLKRFTTADHFLVLDTIINEVVHKHRQELFVVFLDLKKAYDKIDRQALIFKLRRKRIGVNTSCQSRGDFHMRSTWGCATS